MKISLVLHVKEKLNAPKIKRRIAVGSFLQYNPEQANLKGAVLEGAQRYGGANRFCGGVESAGLCATYGADADGADSP